MRFDIHHHIHHEDDSRVLKLLEQIMALSSEVLAAVQAESTQVDSFIALFQGLQAQLATALSGITVPPAVQADIDAIFALTNAEAAKIATASTTTPAGKPAPVA